MQLSTFFKSTISVGIVLTALTLTSAAQAATLNTSRLSPKSSKVGMILRR